MFRIKFARLPEQAWIITKFVETDSIRKTFDGYNVKVEGDGNCNSFSFSPNPSITRNCDEFGFTQSDKEIQVLQLQQSL